MKRGSDSPSIKIEQLKESNYQAWKVRIQHVLTLKDLKRYILNDPPECFTTTQLERDFWKEKDANRDGNESVHKFAVRQLARCLKTMNVAILQSEMAMAL